MKALRGRGPKKTLYDTLVSTHASASSTKTPPSSAIEIDGQLIENDTFSNTTSFMTISTENVMPIEANLSLPLAGKSPFATEISASTSASPASATPEEAVRSSEPPESPAVEVTPQQADPAEPLSQPSRGRNAAVWKQLLPEFKKHSMLFDGKFVVSLIEEEMGLDQEPSSLDTYPEMIEALRYPRLHDNRVGAIITGVGADWKAVQLLMMLRTIESRLLLMFSSFTRTSLTSVSIWRFVLIVCRVLFLFLLRSPARSSSPRQRRCQLAG